MEDILGRVSTVQTNADGTMNAPGASGDASGVNTTAEKTIKDILDERKEQLKDL